MKKNVFAILAIGMLLLSSFAITPTFGKAYKPNEPSNGNIHYVGGSGENNYTRIQDAIDNASDGDTVFVYDDSSPYYENVKVNKSINLIGENKDTTIINASGIVVNVSADNVNISSFTIKGCATDMSLNYVGSNATFYLLTPYPDPQYIADFFNMRFTPEGECTLTACLFSFYYAEGNTWINTSEGVNVIVWDDDGAGFPGAQRAIVNVPLDNISFTNETIVDFSSFDDLTFDDDFHVGFTVVNQTEDRYAILTDDGLHGTERSTYWDGSSWRYIEDDYGFDLNLFITANVTCGGTGISLSDSDNSRIINNTVKENKIGIFVEGSSNNNIIYHNNFIDNYQHAYDNGSNIWNDSYPSGGNYWDDYTGEDNFQGPNQNETGSDGIGDTPYNISGKEPPNQDRYPLMEPCGEEEEPEVIITIEEERPQNNTSNVDIDLSNVSVYVSIYYDPWPSRAADDGAYCEIGGDNITTTISTAYFPGRKEAPVEGPLEYGTTYTWYVNVSLSLTNVHAWRNETFCFTTEGYNEPPVANFTYFINDLTVTFNATNSSDSDGTIIAWNWTFGDGNNGYGMIVEHNYTGEEETIYTVNLTVTDDGGKTGSTSKEIDVTNTPPVANFNYTIDGKTVEFDASSSYDENGTIVSYFWDFGDGTNGTGIEPKHEYAKDYQTYEVTLTVTDSAGATASISKNVTIDDATKPTFKIDKPINALYVNDVQIIQRIRIPLIIGDITIAVNATDENGSGIKQVNFIIDAFRPFAKQEGNATEPNDDDLYTWTWEKNVMFRLLHIHIIKVEVIDNAGNINSQTILVRRFL